jgi:hypothetical protein
MAKEQNHRKMRRIDKAPWEYADFAVVMCGRWSEINRMLALTARRESRPQEMNCR